MASNPRITRPLTFIAGAMLASVAQVFAVPIDDFTGPQGPIFDVTNDAVFVEDTLAEPIVGTGVPGDWSRRIAVSKTNDGLGGVQIEVLPGALLYDALGAVTGHVLVEYEGPSGLDLSSFTHLNLTGLIDSSAASGAGTTLGVRLEDGAANAAISSFVLDTVGDFDRDVPLSDFAAIDVSDIHSVTLGSFNLSGDLVEVPEGGDVTFLQFLPQVDQALLVPEPVSLGMWAIMIGALLMNCILRRTILPRP